MGSPGGGLGHNVGFHEREGTGGSMNALIPEEHWESLIRVKDQIESEQPYLKPLSLMIGAKPEPIGEIFGMKVYINPKLAEGKIIMATEHEVLEMLNEI